MPTPTKRRTSSKTNRNRSHMALKQKALIKCPKCGHLVLAHSVCSFCGTYKKRPTIAIKVKSKTTK